MEKMTAEQKKREQLDVRVGHGEGLPEIPEEVSQPSNSSSLEEPGSNQYGMTLTTSGQEVTYSGTTSDSHVHLARAEPSTSSEGSSLPSANAVPSGRQVLRAGVSFQRMGGVMERGEVREGP